MTAVPPLLALAEGRKARPRKAPVVREKESVLHLAVGRLLRDHLNADWQFTHIPSGEIRDKRTAAKLKAMGTRKSWPDIILVSGHKTCFLELKRRGENLSDGQDDFRSWCVKYGVPYVVAWTMDDVLAALDSWGCLRIQIPQRGGARP